MYLLVAAVLIIVVTVAFTLTARASDVQEAEAISPVQHLEDRRAQIYENLRDLQFEYRVGKLSDADYQSTKLGLQKELAGVLAEMERINKGEPPSPPVSAAVSSSVGADSAASTALDTEPIAESIEEAEPPAAAEAAAENVGKVESTCPHCGARFTRAMRFCGECGKDMQ